MWYVVCGVFVVGCVDLRGSVYGGWQLMYGIHGFVCGMQFVMCDDVWSEM